MYRQAISLLLVDKFFVIGGNPGSSVTEIIGNQAKYP